MEQTDVVNTDRGMIDGPRPRTKRSVWRRGGIVIALQFPILRSSEPRSRAPKKVGSLASVCGSLAEDQNDEPANTCHRRIEWARHVDRSPIGRGRLRSRC